MLLLAADTSGKHGSIALARGNPDASCDVVEEVPLAGGTFSAQLIPQVAAILAKHGLTKEEIGGFAVASGPGSFTGLRVGLAAIKALAEVTGKPIAAVSLLEVVARAAGVSGRVIAILDAGRGEVYLGEYDFPSGKLNREQLLTRADVTAAAEGKTVVSPDGIIPGASVVDWPSAGQVASLGWKRILAGETISPEALEANYIRRSDAEIFSKS
ncbi:MAG TPA: tRNA (adenosine(37)-N6)-threonylcarbamoyltransferase complex dimerization subunit type 1 TsaB [Terriglobales bacterium]|nr:tRNA (adenosine(37)-N6)-threonylcarbamoyltransferase complex dimerization subunit type 1 TsaB [Terriglobales bacterium]